jgi:hypothetical protein
MFLKMLKLIISPTITVDLNIFKLATHRKTMKLLFRVELSQRPLNQFLNLKRVEKILLIRSFGWCQFNHKKLEKYGKELSVTVTGSYKYTKSEEWKEADEKVVSTQVDCIAEDE